MRRTDKEIKDLETIEWILQEAEIVRIALSDNNHPYLVPMNFAYHEKCIYLHSANEGRKIDILKKNNLACFQADIHTQIVKGIKPCNWGMCYYSVMGRGHAQFLDDIKEKKEALNLIFKKYSSQSSFEYSPEDLEAVIVIKIEIHKFTGKKSGY